MRKPGRQTASLPAGGTDLTRVLLLTFTPSRSNLRQHFQSVSEARSRRHTKIINEQTLPNLNHLSLRYSREAQGEKFTSTLSRQVFALGCSTRGISPNASS